MGNYFFFCHFALNGSKRGAIHYSAFFFTIQFQKLKQITDGSLNSDALGADGLRLWVALYGSEGNDARLGANVIADIKKKETQIRNSFRFLLGSLHGFDSNSQLDGLPPYLDQVA